jgi:catalase
MGGLAERAVDATYGVYGRHPGCRALHAKGIVCRGTFRATPAAAELTTAGHMSGEPVAATVRFSKGAGDPTWPDAATDTRGMAVKFHLPSGDATDIVAATMPSFFIRRPEDFVPLLHALTPRRGTERKLNPLRLIRFVVRHPESLRVLWSSVTIKPALSFATTRYEALHAYRWVDAGGTVRHVRYRWLPEEGEVEISRSEGRRRSHDYLQEEIAERLSLGPARFALEVQIAADGDPVDDPTARWPDSRPTRTVGTLTVESVEEGRDEATDPLVMDPTRVTAGIELSDDPVLRFRRSAYEVSAGRRSGVRA